MKRKLKFFGTDGEFMPQRGPEKLKFIRSEWWSPTPYNDIVRELKNYERSLDARLKNKNR